MSSVFLWFVFVNVQNFVTIVTSFDLQLSFVCGSSNGWILVEQPLNSCVAALIFQNMYGVRSAVKSKFQFQFAATGFSD